jgi:hypothetical protein
MLFEFLFTLIEDSQHIVVLRPVDDCDIAGMTTRYQVVPIDDPAVVSQVEDIAGAYAFGMEAESFRHQCGWCAVDEA